MPCKGYFSVNQLILNKAGGMISVGMWVGVGGRRTCAANHIFTTSDHVDIPLVSNICCLMHTTELKDHLSFFCGEALKHRFHCTCTCIYRTGSICKSIYIELDLYKHRTVDLRLYIELDLYVHSTRFLCI